MKSKYTIKILDESGKTIKRFHHQKLEKIKSVIDNEINELLPLFLQNKIDYQINVINNKTHYCGGINIKTLNEAKSKIVNFDIKTYLFDCIFAIIDGKYRKYRHYI